MSGEASNGNGSVAGGQTTGTGGSPTAGGQATPQGAPENSGSSLNGGSPNIPPHQIPDWQTGMNDDNKAYIHQKGFKDAGAVLDSYRNMERLMGVPQERLLKLPSKADDPGWNEVYEKLGRPKDPKEYNISVPEGQGDPKFADWAKKTFHELGLTKNAGESLVNKWTEYVDAQQKSLVEETNARSQKDIEGLKKEWGHAFDKYKTIAEKAASSFGLDQESISKLQEGLGYSKMVKFLHAVGSKLSEGNFHVGNGTTNFNDVMSPEIAKARIRALRNDSDFVRRYGEGDARAAAEFEHLHKMASPESN